MRSADRRRRAGSDTLHVSPAQDRSVERSWCFSGSMLGVLVRTWVAFEPSRYTEIALQPILHAATIRFLMSSRVAVFARLIVFDGAPDRNGCTAATILR